MISYLKFFFLYFYFLFTYHFIGFFFPFSDDELGGNPITPYHFVLPLEVHGAAYAQLQMISKTKAEKLVCIIFK